MAVVPGIFYRQDRGYSHISPVFRDCTFSQNSIVGRSPLQRGHAQTYGTGILHSSLYDIKIESSVVFSYNWGSAVYIVSAVLDLSESSAVFCGNEGIQGGAVGMAGSSTILVGPHNYTFQQNSAVDRGGAIYSFLVDIHDFTISRSCFLQYVEQGRRVQMPSSQWNATITFTGNTARSGIGSDIFVSSLRPCLLTGRNDYAELDIAEIFQPPGVIFTNTTYGHSIASEGAYFINNSGYLHAVPGERVLHGVRVLDELNQSTSSTLIASFPSPAADVEVASSSTCLSGHVIELVGKPHQSGSLLLETTNPARTVFTYLEVEMLDCPPGFVLIDNSCQCDSDSYTALLHCDNHNLHSYRRPGFWVGYVHNSDRLEELVSTICPWGFCKLPMKVSNHSDQEIGLALPHNREDLENIVCSKGRRGALCGSCSSGYTVLFHSRSYNCSKETDHQCKLGPLYYFLSELLPATILFIIVLIFNISFTSGSLNGFILYSQLLDPLLIDASGVIQYPPNTKIALQVVSAFYGFFNLNFFDIESFSYCLWKDATVLGIVAFKYVTICYSIFLIVMVLLFLRHCGTRCLGNFYRVTVMRNSVIQGLSAFLVIGYSQCIKISFSLLYSISLIQRPGASGVYHRRVWYNGDMIFFSSSHLRFALPALAVLLTIGVLPPVILLTYPAIFQVLACLKIRGSCRDKCLPFYSTIKPFLDAFQGSFKDRCRFFAGLYFMYRWVGVLLYAIVPQYTIFCYVVEVVLLLMLLLHAVLQPYIKHWHNILDALLLANLILIIKFTARNYYITRVDAGISYQANIDRASAFQVILMYLPVIYLVCYVACSAIQQCITSSHCKRMCRWLLSEY